MKDSKKEKGIIHNKNRTASIEGMVLGGMNGHESVRLSPVIIPRMIRTVSCYGYIPSTSSPPPPLSLDADEDSYTTKITQSYEKKIRVPKNQSENVYLNKALDFLTGIEVRNENQDIKLEFPPSSEESEHEESREESNDLTWVTHSGKVCKSYAYCLSYDDDFTEYPQIDLSDAPITIRNSPLKENFNEEFRLKYPFLDHKLTLSKIVNLKEGIIFKLCKEVDIEAYTVAVA